VAAGTLLYLMFSTGDEVVRRTGLFGALFFETARISGGGLGITMGVASPATLLTFAGILALVLAWVQLVYLVLRGYRARLIEAGVHHR
jgi:hypothetical protein